MVGWYGLVEIFWAHCTIAGLAVTLYGVAFLLYHGTSKALGCIRPLLRKGATYALFVRNLPLYYSEFVASELHTRQVGAGDTYTGEPTRIVVTEGREVVSTAQHRVML